MQKTILTVRGLPLILVLTILLTNPGLAGQASSAGLMTNDEVIRLVKAGLGDEIVIAKIRESGSNTKFDLSVDGLILLKQAGVSEAVIKAMLAPAATGGIGEPAAGGDAVQDTGVFVEQDGHLLRLEPIVVSSKPGSMGKSILVLPGRSSQTALLQTQPKFVFSFANAVGALAMSGPAEFVLLKADPKESTREIKVRFGVVISQLGLPFSYEETNTRRYVVIPKTPLPPGEYTFYHSGTDRFFDFKITPQSTAGSGKQKKK